VPTFQPPSHEEPIRTDVKPLCYYRLTWANSIVRVSGVLTGVRGLTAERIAAAGIEGTDWFRGGGIYTVTAPVAAELTAAGFGSGLS
jgi:hypothetical protein